MTGLRSTSTKSSSSTSSPTSSSKRDPLYLSLKFSYEVEFSKPHLVKPIPEGTVKVFFSLIERSAGDPLIEFNFENESLKHKLDNTMRTNMFEVSLSLVLPLILVMD